ncbi:MAG: hypothetical protein JOZ29_12900 [Deltaproteobacteria bacterium]|nr:hypothetical protein [Deltaproteobacteria bacterium]
MIVVPGLSLKNLKPRVWDRKSPFFLRQLRAVMVSYADFHRLPSFRRAAMKSGLASWLGVPDGVDVYLDNGAFYFLGRPGPRPRRAYEEFVEHAAPNWWPIPQDYIPTPSMPARVQARCYERTMEINRAYERDGFVPVVHIGPHLSRYTSALLKHPALRQKPRLALGGIVPNLLRTPKALAYAEVFKGLLHVRREFQSKHVHVFGIGGTATIHVAALIKADSVDSSGWRNRAARGLIQLPGSGERMVTNLGNWRGREPSRREWEQLAECRCPACRTEGLKGLKSKGIQGFSYRATHNLFVLLEEAKWVERQLAKGTYEREYQKRLDNSIYSPLIRELLRLQADLS